MTDEFERDDDAATGSYDPQPLLALHAAAEEQTRAMVHSFLSGFLADRGIADGVRVEFEPEDERARLVRMTLGWSWREGDPVSQHLVEGNRLFGMAGAGAIPQSVPAPPVRALPEPRPRRRGLRTAKQRKARDASRRARQARRQQRG